MTNPREASVELAISPYFTFVSLITVNLFLHLQPVNHVHMAKTHADATVCKQIVRVAAKTTTLPSSQRTRHLELRPWSWGMVLGLGKFRNRSLVMALRGKVQEFRFKSFLYNRHRTL